MDVIINYNHMEADYEKDVEREIAKHSRRKKTGKKGREKL